MRWLHISDIHYSPPGKDYDTDKMLEKLYDCITRDHIKVQEVFFSGDFRFAKPPCTVTPEQVAGELRKIARLAGVTDPANIHIVPGNHDLTWDEDENTTPLLDRVYEQYKDNGAFIGKLNKKGREIPCQKYLLKRFRFFYKVARELNDPVWNGPQKLHHYRKQGSCRIVYLNTAAACGRKNERGGLVIGYNDLYEELCQVQGAFTAAEKELPGIALGHHGLYCLNGQERNKIKELFKGFNIGLYLCGDAHFGDDAVFDGFTQITAGCLKKDVGTENAFFVGTLSENGGKSIQAYTYDHNHFGWNKNSVFSAQINKNFGPVAPEYLTRENEKIIGRNEKIEDIEEKLKARQSALIEVSGPAGVGKSTVCYAALDHLGETHISVDARIHNTAHSIQKYLLEKLGIDANNLAPAEYAAVLLETAIAHKQILYIDNAETPTAKDQENYIAWLNSFSLKSEWHVLYSTQRSLDIDRIKPIPLAPLQKDDAIELFVQRWINPLSDEDLNIAKDIVIRLMSALPLAIRLITSPAQQKKYPTPQKLRQAIEKHETFEHKDDPQNPHRSMTAALALARAEVEKDKNALIMWSVFAQFAGEFSDDLYDLVFDNNEYNQACLTLREYSLLDVYKMLSPIKEEANSFADEIKEAAAYKLSQMLTRMFNKADDWQAADRDIWHSIAVDNIPAALAFLVNALQYGDNAYKFIAPVFYSARNYFKFSSYESLAALKTMEPLYRAERDNLGLANVLLEMGDLECRLGQIEDAQKHYADAEQLYRAERANLGLANVLKAMGDLERGRQNYPAAIDSYNIALGLYEAEQEPQGISYTMGELCKVYALAGNSGEALYWLERVAEAFEGMPEYVKPYVAECLDEARELLKTE
jgi:predicted MPP superfamily phosphohydrolase